jgi:hypothetical protein
MAKLIECQRCGRPMKPARGDRPRKWCSQSCRQRDYEQRKGVPMGRSPQGSQDGAVATERAIRGRGEARRRDE